MSKGTLPKKSGKNHVCHSHKTVIPSASSPSSLSMQAACGSRSALDLFLSLSPSLVSLSLSPSLLSLDALSASAPHFEFLLSTFGSHQAIIASLRDTYLDVVDPNLRHALLVHTEVPEPRQEREYYVEAEERIEPDFVDLKRAHRTLKTPIPSIMTVLTQAKCFACAASYAGRLTGEVFGRKRQHIWHRKSSVQEECHDNCVPSLPKKVLCSRTADTHY